MTEWVAVRISPVSKDHVGRSLYHVEQATNVQECEAFSRVGIYTFIKIFFVKTVRQQHCSAVEKIVFLLILLLHRRRVGDEQICIPEHSAFQDRKHAVAKTLFIESGSPGENGYIKSFNGKLRDELLDRKIFDTLLEAKGLTER